MESNQNIIIKPTNSTDNNSSSALDFEMQRCQLFQEAQVGLGQIQNNLNCLNNNLKVIVDIGSQFCSVSHLWSSFHKAVNEDDDNDTNNHGNISKFDSPSFEFDKSMLERVLEEERETENQRHPNVEHQLDYNTTVHNSSYIAEILSFDKD